LSDPEAYAARKARLLARLVAQGSGTGVRKRSSSNLFRYKPRPGARAALDLREFNHMLGIDAQTRTLDVEGLATFESIVDAALPRGLVPLITPELKDITIAGATVGIGIESNCFRHGFVHDGLLEAEVLLADGRIVTCNPDNDHADLFGALPNSYGTLGYILRARMKLMPAEPYVHLESTPCSGVDGFLEAMHAATRRDDVDFIEGMAYSGGRMFVTLARFSDHVPQVDDILREKIFYRLIERARDVYLTTKDYLFRYDPEWFWNIPESWPYRLFRRFAPASMRRSGFYKRYTGLKNRLLAALPLPGRLGDREEPLIQDWEVPWDRAAELMRFAMSESDLSGKPWIATPIRPVRAPTLYPVTPGKLYFNLGSYCQVRKPPGKGDYYYTKIIDRKCFDLGGIKMLYSSTFLDEDEFDRIYNGTAYAALKAKYDPGNLLGTLYEKCVIRES
jgi:FAD/FMN-containing dehydrogenase